MQRPRPRQHVLRYAVLLAVLAGCAAPSAGGSSESAAGAAASPNPVTAAGRTAPAGAASSSAMSSTATTPAPAPTVTPGSPGAVPGGLTIAFGGDIHFEGRVGRLLDGDDGLSELRATLGAADLAVVNLETAITDRGVPQPKIYHFRTTPKALTTLASAGVDVVSMANNHSVDFGPDGLVDTLAARDASPVPVVGIGRNAADAFAPAVVTVRGLRVAVIASTQINDYTVNTFPATATAPGVAGNLRNDRLLQAVKAARATSDVLVVFLHWGTDYTTCPDRAQVATATAMAAAGADVVVGSHAHRIQGSGWLGSTFVGYGLGNFVWLNTRGEADTRSGVLTVTVDEAAVRARAALPPNQWSTQKSVVVAQDYAPMRVSDDGIPRRPADADVLTAAWEQARSCARLRSHP